MAKTFKTAFEIGAKFTGQQAFGKVFSQLDKVGRKAKAATVGFGKMFGAVVAGINSSILAWKAFDAVVDIGKASYDAAKDVKKAYDVVRQANALLVSEGRMSAKDLESRTQKTMKFAETLSKSGLDAETLAVGLAGLSRSFDSKTIEKMGKGWMDWMVKIHKGAPTMEQAQADAQKLQAFVEKGNARSLEGMGITKEQRESLNDLGSAQERSAALAKILGVETGALNEWLKTDAGVAYTAAQAQESLLEKMGGPMVEATRKLNEAMTELYKALEPVADLIAGYLKQGLDDFAKWIITNKEEIKTFTKVAITFLKNRLDELIISFQDCYRQGKWLWENLVKSFDDTKAQWTAIVDWLDKYVIKPIYNIFFWLWEKITWIWNQIVPKLNAASAATGGNTNYQQMGAGGGGGGGGRSGYPAVDEGGNPLPPEGSTGRGQSMGQFYSAEAAAQSPGSKEARRRVIAELNADPALREKLIRVAHAEVGTGNERRTTAFMEGILTRAALRPGGLAAALQPNYYETLRKGPLAMPSAADIAKHEKAIKRASEGSNVGNYGTGNYAYKGGGLGGRGGYPSAFIGGEQFSVQAADAKKIAQIKEYDRAQQTKMVKGPPEANTHPGGVKDAQGRGITPAPPGTSSLRGKLRGMDMRKRTEGVSPTNIAMNPTINVNGVAAGSEELVAQKFARVLRNNSKENLEQLRRDRNFQLRTGYV